MLPHTIVLFHIYFDLFGDPWLKSDKVSTNLGGAQGYGPAHGLGSKLVKKLPTKQNITIILIHIDHVVPRLPLTVQQTGMGFSIVENGPTSDSYIFR